MALRTVARKKTFTPKKKRALVMVTINNDSLTIKIKKLLYPEPKELTA
ncbi:hypothetical protein [Enterobacter hormaechei]